MKGKAFLSVGTFCILGSVVCAYLSLPNRPEGLFANPCEIDLGNLEQAQTVDAVFELANRFRQRLKITGIFESCGCSTTGIEKNQLEPGGQTKLSAVWKTGARRGPSNVQLDVQYSLEDGQTGFVKLIIKGKIIPDIHYAPEELVFEGGANAKKVIQLHPARIKDFAIKSAYSSHRAFKALVNQQQKTVSVEFDPGQWRSGDDANPRVTIVTSSGRVPQLQVYVKVVNPTTKE